MSRNHNAYKGIPTVDFTSVPTLEGNQGACKACGAVLKQEKPMPSIAMHRADQPARAGGAMWLCEKSSLPPNGNSNVGDDP